MFYLAPDNSVMQGWLPTFDKVKDDFSLLGLPIISCLNKKLFQISLLPETLRNYALAKFSIFEVRQQTPEQLCC